MSGSAHAIRQLYYVAGGKLGRTRRTDSCFLMWRRERPFTSAASAVRQNWITMCEAVKLKAAIERMNFAAVDNLNSGETAKC
jgi:hypothetical protein